MEEQYDPNAAYGRNGGAPADIAGRNARSELTEEYEIHSYEMDSVGRMSVISLCNMFQDAAGKHAGVLGVSVHELLKDNCTWMLSRLSLNVGRYPMWGEKIKVKTWPFGIDRLFALRAFSFMDGGGKTFGDAVTAWLLINTKTRRPVRIRKYLKERSSLFDEEVPDGAPVKIDDVEDCESGRPFTVRYSDIDVNQHVNTTSYIEWMIEGAPRDVLESGSVGHLDVNFLSEAFYGDRVISACSPDKEAPGTLLHSIRRERDGSELTRGRTEWQSYGD